MSEYIDELKKAFGKLEGDVKADVDEIRKYKNQLQYLTEMLYDTVKSGQYLRDPKRIIISAPEIIIGNVDHQGSMLGDGGSIVVVRGNNVCLEGTGSPSVGGNVVTRASSIRQIAVDPGKDGLENVVCPFRSEIVNQAVSIAVRSDNVKGAFVEAPGGGAPGISVHSDTDINLLATPSNKNRTSFIDREIKNIDTQSKNISSGAKTVRQNIDKLLDEISKLSEKQNSINDSETNIRSKYADMPGLQKQFESLEVSLCSRISEYVNLLASKTELSRKSDALKKIKNELSKTASSFSKDPTHSGINISSESVNISNIDGDGNIRENPASGFRVLSPHISIMSNDNKTALIKDSTMDINVQKFNLSTANAKLDDKMEKGTIEAVGDVTVTSKNIAILAIDNELKDKKIQEKALTRGGTFKLRAEKIKAESSDTEGKSVGEIRLNAKNIQLASMNLDKEKRTDKEMAPGSQMVLLSEKMFTGSLDKKSKSKLLQLVSDKVSIIGDTTAEMQQGESKAVLTLDGGNLTAGGGKNELSGDTTIKGKADIKGDVEAPNGKFKGVEASGKFKSTNISDGMMGGTAGAPGKPSAKMKMEEAQKPQN